MRHSFLLILILTCLFSLRNSTISAQDEYDKQDDCTFALQMYDGDELLNQVLLDAVDSTGHPYAHILVNGRVWDPYYTQEHFAGCNHKLCRCAYGQYPFTFFPATQIKNPRICATEGATNIFEEYWDSWRRKVYLDAEELRYYYFKRSRTNPFALYIFDGKDLYYSTSLTKDGEPYIVGDGHYQIDYAFGTVREGYEMYSEYFGKYPAEPIDENIAYWDKIQKRINKFRFLKGTPETLSINTHKLESTNITLKYDANTKELHHYGTNEATILLYTTGGQMYREYHSTGTIHLKDLPNGIYIAKAISKDGQIAVKSIAI